MIPQPFDPVSLDPYAYTDNNPVNRTDPSGHDADCSALDTACKINSFDSYGITLSGNWSWKDKWQAYSGVVAVAHALSKAVGLDKFVAYNTAFGNMTFKSVSRSDICNGCYGQTDYPVIKFFAGMVNVYNVVHELGHAFERAIWTRNGNAYTGTTNPVEFLVTDYVKDEFNNFVTGVNPSDYRYERYNPDFAHAPASGYRSDGTRYQQHGNNFPDDYLTDPGENWADIFLNWTIPSFVDNPAGRALNKWVSSNMNVWINSGR
jgi:hypothetical protein